MTTNYRVRYRHRFNFKISYEGLKPLNKCPFVVEVPAEGLEREGRMGIASCNTRYLRVIRTPWVVSNTP